MKESERYEVLIRMIIAKQPNGYFELLDWLFKKYDTAKMLEGEDVKQSVQ